MDILLARKESIDPYRELWDNFKNSVEYKFNVKETNLNYQQNSEDIKEFIRKTLQDMINHDPIIKTGFQKFFKNGCTPLPDELVPEFIQTRHIYEAIMAKEIYLMPEEGTDWYHVVQANPLVEAQYKLDLLPQQLVRVLISMIQPSYESFSGKFYQINIATFGKQIGRKNTSGLRKELLKAADQLLTTTVIVKDGKNKIKTQWFWACRHDPEKGGLIDFMFSSFLAPYLLQLKAREYTQYQVNNICRLNSQYSIRFYELIKQYTNIPTKKRVIPLTKLKEILGIDEKYPRYANIKERIFDPAHKEIHEKTDLQYKWRPIKSGRKVTKIEFYDIKLEVTITEDLISLIPEEHRKNKKMFSIIKKYLKLKDKDYITEKLQYVKKMHPQNYPIYLIRVLENDYGYLPNSNTDVNSVTISPIMEDKMLFNMGMRYGRPDNSIVEIISILNKTISLIDKDKKHISDKFSMDVKILSQLIESKEYKRIN